jgi:hypothetical protein
MAGALKKGRLQQRAGHATGPGWQGWVPDSTQTTHTPHAHTMPLALHINHRSTTHQFHPPPQSTPRARCRRAARRRRPRPEPPAPSRRSSRYLRMYVWGRAGGCGCGEGSDVGLGGGVVGWWWWVVGVGVVG